MNRKEYILNKFEGIYVFYRKNVVFTKKASKRLKRSVYIEYSKYYEILKKEYF